MTSLQAFLDQQIGNGTVPGVAGAEAPRGGFRGPSGSRLCRCSCGRCEM